MKMIEIKDWDDVEEVLCDGSREEILSLRCPDCGGAIEYRGSKTCSSFEMRCRSCGYISRGHGVPSDIACVRFFGGQYKIPLHEKQKSNIS